MPRFKNKKTGTVVEANLLYYVNLLRSNPDYKELKENDNKPKDELKLTAVVEQQAEEKQPK